MKRVHDLTGIAIGHNNETSDEKRPIENVKTT